MMKMYREHVFGEKMPEGFVPLGNLLSGTPVAAKKVTAEAAEEVGAMGD